MPAGSVLMTDPLDGSNPYWQVVTTESCAIGYQSGSYHVGKLPAARAEDCGAHDVESTVYADFALEVDVRLVDAPPAAFASIGLREDIAEFSTQFLAGYAVHIDPELGTVALVYDYGTTYTRLAEARPASLRPAGEWNRVAITATGPRIQVAVNGEVALDVQDARHPWGTITLGVGAPGDESAEAAYRNFELRRP